MAVQDGQDLNGKRIVVVEDDFLLATDICRELRELGATVLGPAPTPFYALHMINHKKVDAAVLDVRLHGTTVFEVAERLQDQGIPILFATAADHTDLPIRFHEAPLLPKPLDRKKLVSELLTMTHRLVAPAFRMAAKSDLPMTVARAPAQVFARAIARTMKPVTGV